MTVHLSWGDWWLVTQSPGDWDHCRVWDCISMKHISWTFPWTIHHHHLFACCILVWKITFMKKCSSICQLGSREFHQSVIGPLHVLIFYSFKFLPPTKTKHIWKPLLRLLHLCHSKRHWNSKACVPNHVSVQGKANNYSSDSFCDWIICTVFMIHFS